RGLSGGRTRPPRGSGAARRRRRRRGAARRDGRIHPQEAAGMITVEEHRDRILGAVPTLEATQVPLVAALGRILREPVRSAVDLPLFDNSAMDGFAVRFADVADATADSPVGLEVVADVPAGSADDPAFGLGQAVRIMTGAPVPRDADAIVPFEDTAGGLADSLGGIRVLSAPHAVGAH